MRQEDRWWWLGLAAITAVAFAIRVVYVLHWRSGLPIGGDTFYYHHAANLLADGNGFLNPFFSKPGHPYQSADHPPLYQLYLAFISRLGVRSPTGHMLWTCVLGSGSVLVAGLTGREMAGPRAGLIAAALTAAYANVWSWDGMILSESMAIFTVTLTLWAAYRYWRRPSLGRAVTLGAAAALATLSRAELLLLLPFVVVPLLLRTRTVELRRRLRWLAGAGLAVVVLVGPWVGYNMVRFEHPVYLSVGFEITLSSANCADTYYGPLLGYWTTVCPLQVRKSIPPGLDQSEEVPYFRKAAFDFIGAHKGRVPIVVLARWGRITHLWRPWQQATLDWFPEGRDLWVTRTGLISYYALAAFGICGAVVLRRRKVPVYPLVAPLAIVLVTVTIAFATTRYRASAETALALLAAAGIAGVLEWLWPARTSSPGEPVQLTTE